jgi:hypothetical protein
VEGVEVLHLPVKVVNSLDEPVGGLQQCVVLRYGTGESMGGPMLNESSSLTDLLRLATWGPRDLVASINSRLSAQQRDRLRLDPTTGYSWTQGGRPRLYIRLLAASVLSERLGFKVDAAQLWPGSDDAELAAAGGFDGMTHIDDVLVELSRLAAIAGTPLNPVGDASGLDLVTVVLDQLHGPIIATRKSAERESVHPEQVALIADHVADLRRLDDKHGGGILSVRYATTQLHSVIDMFDYARYDEATGNSLLKVAADLSQLLGWLHFDSSRYGAAERYMLLSVGICRSLKDFDRSANVIGMLSYISAFAGHGRQAVHLAEAARAECRTDDPFLMARLLGREATAAAADGDLLQFRRCAEKAAELLDGMKQRKPEFLYYLTPVQLAAEAGQALVTIANRTNVHQERLLDEGIATLGVAVPEMIGTVEDRVLEFARSGLLHSTFLARAQLQRGKNGDAVDTLRASLPLLPTVQSPRGRNYLKQLRPVLGRRTRSQVVREFLPQFDAALLNA